MRRHLTYANLAATLALVLAMSGGALAAKHYLINSTKQINPKVLRKLRGNTGPKGPAGARGTQGAQGAPGQAGAEGRAAPVLVPISNTAASVAFAGSSAEVITSVTLPAGTYSLLAATRPENTSGAPIGPNCLYRDSKDVFGEVKETVGAKSTGYIALPGTLLTVTAPSEEVSLACKGEGAEGAFKEAKLIATKIG